LLFAIDYHFITILGLSHQLRNRAKERERERRRSSGANLPSGMVPRVVRRNESISERTLNEIENRECFQILFHF
jgi:hypothetical protein